MNLSLKMDIKVKREPMDVLCHGCLTEDRTVHCISGEISEMFYLLTDDKFNKRLKLALCWECVAFLKKLKMFQARIKMAHCLLIQHLQSHYRNDDITRPTSLSSLNKLHINTFNYEFHEDENINSDVPDNATKLQDKEENKDSTDEYEKKESIDIDEDLLTEIKVEYNNSIKEKYNSSNDNDSDYYEPVLKVENKESKEKPTRVRKRISYRCTMYQKLATVTRRKDISKKTYLQFAESVSLEQKEYKNVLKRDRGRYGYPRMPFKCSECKEGYLKKIDLQKHNSVCHSDKFTFPYKCVDCPITMTSREHQDEHWTDAHSKLYKCTLCSEVYQSAFEITKHIKTKHRKIYSCKECGSNYGGLREFRKHYRTIHERVICDYCKEGFHTKERLISHMKRYHIPICCKKCDRIYANHKSLKAHNQVTHPELFAGETRKELSYCVECDLQFLSVYKYRRHLQQSVRHTKQKVPCPDCGKIFSKMNFMQNHYRCVHLKVTKNYCDQCDKYYATSSGLRQHIATFHKKIPQPKNKLCDLCGRGFSTNRILRNHRRTHTGERPFQCKYCPAAFAQKIAMKTHQKTQHKNDLSS